MVAETLTAILLVGGKGTRMYPSTDPKCLADLNGKAMLFHIMEWIGKCVTGFVLCLGYRPDAIKEACARRYVLAGSNIEFSDAGEDASQSRRILEASKMVRGRLLVCYGDEVAQVPVDELLKFHRSKKALVTVTVHPLKSEFGIVESGRTGKVERMREKPVLPHWMNIGFMVWEREALVHLEGRDLPDALNAVAKAGKLYAYRFEGNRVTANSEAERLKAEQAMLDWERVKDGVLAG